MQRKKKFRLIDAVLATVCLILVVEAAAPSAAIGHSQYFWWILLLVAFFLPYGLISAELGTTYRDDGGLFDWVKRAYGRKWGSRVAWYYWINYAFWVASLAVLFTAVIDQAFGTNIPTAVAVLIQLVLIWVVSILSCFSISENKTLINIGTVFKVVLMGTLGVLGIYWAVTRGVANPVAGVGDFLPGLLGVSFVPVILFNFMGFEVVATFASDMDKPKKQIPQALLMGGICIAAFYLLASFGIGVAVPIEYLTDAETSISYGFLESFLFFFSGLAWPIQVLLPVIGVIFLYTLIVNLLSWALGVNYVASYAAENNAMPAIFGKRLKSNKAPVGSAIMNGIVASALVIAAPFIPNQDIFWGFFALQIITLLMSYMIMFPAFKRLRRIDPNAERPYKAPGGPFMINVMTYIPLVLLVLAAIFCMVYPDYNGGWVFDEMLIIGTVCAIIAGEIVTHYTGTKVGGKL
jgi:amino acid transporter